MKGGWNMNPVEELLKTVFLAQLIAHLDKVGKIKFARLLYVLLVQLKRINFTNLEDFAKIHCKYINITVSSSMSASVYVSFCLSVCLKNFLAP